jgi:ribosome-associated protein
VARGPYNSYVTNLLEAAISAAQEKIAEQTVVLDLRDLVDSFDALVVTSGRNDRHVRAIAEEIEEYVTQSVGVKPSTVEGLREGTWIALDYGDVIVHVFDDEHRDYYDLEHLWSAAPQQRINDVR